VLVAFWFGIRAERYSFEFSPVLDAGQTLAAGLLPIFCSLAGTQRNRRFTACRQHLAISGWSVMHLC
jgi:hypothetical protein